MTAGLLVWSSLSAQGDEVKAAVDMSVLQDQEIWAGQQVTVNLDLKTTGFNFSNSHFNLPEVSGAFLMQTDTTTIKLSEIIDGETWQIIRYPLALYPQKAGRLEIPPIDVRFTTSAGYGSTPKAFEFQTKALNLTVSLPPGVKEGDLVVTTSSFELDHDWQPASGTARTGDAFTLTVSRRASDISAMLLPPLPVFRTAGLEAYSQAPEVNDKTDRGELIGERIDRIILVVENPGQYEIPGIRFQWWDPRNRELKQQIVPGMSLDIMASATDGTAIESVERPVQNNRSMLQVLILALAALSIIFIWRRFGWKIHDADRDDEKLAFTQLQNACRRNNPAGTYSAIHTWLRFFSPPNKAISRPLTLAEFARLCMDPQLAAELDKLQEVLISRHDNWSGGDLLTLLKNIRDKSRRRIKAQSDKHLALLNP